MVKCCLGINFLQGFRDIDPSLDVYKLNDNV